jgi:glycosyltransferase involved in cell wall biosynthesis
MTPQISIITPLYNKENYIRQTIESVLCQSLQNWEMLVIDNGSTDASFEIARQFDDQRIHFFQCPKRGPGATRNYGIERAKGDWIQFLDGDDLLAPQHLTKQLAVAQHNPAADIIVSCWQVFSDADPDNKILQKPAGLGESIEALRGTAIAYTPWSPHAALVKRSILTEDVLWPEKLDRFLAEDTAFWFCLVNKFQVAYNTSSEALYRSEVPGSRTNFNPEKWFEGNHFAVKHNLSYLQNNSIPLNSYQYEALVRLYSGLYLNAYREKSFSIQEKSLQEAKFWLKSYFQTNHRPNFSMLLRRLMGIKQYITLTQTVSWLTSR